MPRGAANESCRAEPPREVVAAFVKTAAYDETERAAQARAFLGAEERHALDRLRVPAARRDYLAAHVLVRTLLAGAAGCEPDRLRLRSRPWRRPEIVAPAAARRFRFSLSHADGIALCAVSASCGVGADVESRRNLGHDPLATAPVVCSARELDALGQLCAAQRADRLLCTWTVKEAVTKAIGVGCDLPFDRMTVHWENGNPAGVEIDASFTSAPAEWRVVVARLTADHVAAVALVGPTDRRVAVRFEERLAGPGPASRR